MTHEDPRYGPEVRLRMATLAGAGDIAPGQGVVSAIAGEREQGVLVVLQARITGDCVAELRFRAFGCPHLLAAASWLTERLRGVDRHVVEAWDWREAATVLEVPPAKFGRLLVLQDAVRILARNWPGGGQPAV